MRLAQIAEERARKRAEARKARDKLAAEVLVLARQVFAMLDVDDGGTLSRDEIVRGVEEDEVANAASHDRAPFDLLGAWWCFTRRFRRRRSSSS